MDIVAVNPIELTPASMDALAKNHYRYYATAVDGYVLFRKSLEVRAEPPQSREQKEQVNGSSN